MYEEELVDPENYFGVLDAAYEPELLDFFVKVPIISRLKLGSKKTGKFIVAGAKGTGKSAICEYLSQTTGEKSSLFWRVDEQRPFMKVPVARLGEYPGEVQSVLLSVILTQLINMVAAEKEHFGAGAKEALEQVDKDLFSRAKEHFKNFLKGASIKAGPIVWDFGKIIGSSDKADFTEFDVETYIEALRKCFADRPALILFDDIDDIFLGADKPEYSTFVEGLIRAAKTLNLKFGERLHFHVFIKYGVYRSFYDSPRDYDKVKDYIMIPKWDRVELERMLAHRIAKRFGVDDGIPPWRAWAKVFRPRNKTAIKAIQKYLFDRCPSGPRDVIDFCNRAVARKGAPSVSMLDLEACEMEFSNDKITSIYQDYGFTYPEIHHLIKKCFSKGSKVHGAAGPRVTYLKHEFDELIFRVLSNTEIKDRFGKHRYFDLATTSELTRILYTVGFIGYRDMEESPPKFVLDDPKGESLHDASSYVVHRAFLRALHLG